MTNEDVLRGPLARGKGPNLLPTRFGENLAFGVLKKAPTNLCLASTMDVTACGAPTRLW